MTETSVRVLDPRVDPEPPDWAAFLVRQQLYPVWDYGLMRMEAWLARNPPVLALARDGGGAIVAAVSAMVCRPWGVGYGTPRYAPAPSVHGRRFGPRWVEVCLPWLSGHPAMVFGPDLPVAHRRRVIRAVERELARHVGPGLLGVLYRPVPRELAAVLGGRCRPASVIDTTAVLENRWSTVDEWLAGLGRERRRSIKRYGRRIEADRTLIVESGPGRADLDPHELAGLLNGHRVRLGVGAFDRRTPVAGAYLEPFLRRPDVHTLTYRDAGGTLLAFNTLIDHPVRPVLQHWATRPVSDGGRYNLYFDCYLRGVRHMVDHERAELWAGRGLQDIKASLGFTRRELVSVAVPRPLIGR